MIDASPAVWFFGGGGGAALLMMLVRQVLKQYGYIGVDRHSSQGEIAIHQAYKTLIANFEKEIERLHLEIARMQTAMAECEARNRTAEEHIVQLRYALAKKGIL